MGIKHLFFKYFFDVFYLRVLKSKGMSVGDASAVWFLSVLGATASAAMPLSPHLRDLILTQTK